MLNIFVSGRLQDYLEFYANQKSFIESSGVKHDRNITKMRVLTFLQNAENQKEMTFETIRQDMQIPLEEVESFIIEGTVKTFFYSKIRSFLLAVRTKMVRCKIDHLGRKVIIDSTVQRTFTKQHWSLLKEKLEGWQSNLTTINSNLATLLATRGTTN